MSRIAALALCVLPALASARPVPLNLKVGQRYEAGARVLAHEMGASFVVPKAWFGAMPEGADTFMMASNTQLGMVLVSAIEGDPATVLEALRRPIEIESGAFLKPVKVTRKGQRVVGAYRLDGGQPIVGMLRAALHPSGKAVVVLHVVPRRARPASKRLVEGLVRSVKWHSAAQMARSGSANWMAIIGGKQLEHYQTGTGVANSDRIALCSDGTFRQDGSNSLASSLTSETYFRALQVKDEAGRWRIAGNTLILQSSDGIAKYALSRPGGELHLDGDRWFAAPNTVCR